jgi:UDP-3-O-[3-hydroxymyristoyl] glucosamine N-acyltransferase
LSDDIQDLANVAIDNRNQTNHRVVIGLDFLMVKGYGLSKIADIRMQYDLSGFFR